MMHVCIISNFKINNTMHAGNMEPAICTQFPVPRLRGCSLRECKERSSKNQLVVDRGAQKAPETTVKVD